MPINETNFPKLDGSWKYAIKINFANLVFINSQIINTDQGIKPTAIIKRLIFDHDAIPP